jgi:PAS domain S-box-containing protein
MPWQLTPYTLPLVVTVGFLLLFGGYIWRLGHTRTNRTRGTTLAALLMVVAAEWVLAYLLTLSSTELGSKLLWNRFEFLGMAFLPVVWFAYVLWYTGRTEWLTRRVFGGIGGVAAGFTVLAWANGFHFLIWEQSTLESIGSFVVVQHDLGPAFWAFVAFIYSLQLASALLLGNTVLESRGILRWQAGVLLGFALFPGAAGLVDLAGLPIFRGLNIAALATVVTSVVGAVTVLECKWLDLSPVGRDQLVDAVTEPLIVIDADDRIVDLNPPATRLAETTTTAAVGQPLDTLFPTLATTFPTHEDGENRELELSVDGTHRTFDVRVSPLRARGTEQAGEVIILHDITARKRAEKQVRTQSTKIERLHSVAQDLAAARSTDEIYQIAVDGAADVLDCSVCRAATVDGNALYPQASSADEPVDDCPPVSLSTGYAGYSYTAGEIIVIDDLTDTRSAASQQSSSTGTPTPSASSAPSTTATTQEPIQKQELKRALLSAPLGDVGVLQALSTEAAAFDEQDAELVELLVSHVEIALDRVAAEDELRQERDRLDEFASVISHDLRNPLNVAQGRLDLAMEEIENKHLEPANQALTRMDALIDDLLTLAREGQTVGTTDQIALEGVVKTAWNSLETAHANLAIEEELPTIEADESRLCELFENLFRNAVEHGGEDVSITVGQVEAGFYVADDGPGIPADKRDEVFESGYSTNPDGTGFGLAIVRKIADAHGWEVDITESESGGARFECSGVRIV